MTPEVDNRRIKLIITSGDISSDVSVDGSVTQLF